MHILLAGFSVASQRLHYDEGSGRIALVGSRTKLSILLHFQSGFEVSLITHRPPHNSSTSTESHPVEEIMDPAYPRVNRTPTLVHTATTLLFADPFCYDRHQCSLVQPLAQCKYKNLLKFSSCILSRGHLFNNTKLIISNPDFFFFIWACLC